MGVILFNHSDVDFEGADAVQVASQPAPLLIPSPLAVKKGDRVAQLILERIVTPEVAEVEDLDDTTRGAGGFGSTGVAAVLN